MAFQQPLTPSFLCNCSRPLIAASAISKMIPSCSLSLACFHCLLAGEKGSGRALSLLLLHYLPIAMVLGLLVALSLVYSKHCPLFNIFLKALSSEGLRKSKARRTCLWSNHSAPPPASGSRMCSRLQLAIR